MLVGDIEAPEIIIPKRVPPKEMEEYMDRFAEQEWKLMFETAKAAMHKAIDDGALDQVCKNTPERIGDMKLEAVFDQREFIWLCEQYGADTILDEDFLHFYRKARNQVRLESV